MPEGRLPKTADGPATNLPRALSLFSQSVAWLAGALGLLASTACLSSGSLQVEALGTAARPPSNVAIYLSVSDGEEPVAELRAEDFSLFENDQLLSAAETGQRLLDRTTAAAHRTLLLVDVSAATPDDVRRELQAAQELFAETVRQSQPVSIYVFDGGPAIRLLLDLERDSKPSKTKTPRSPVPQDRSRNLNGAVLQALEQLDARAKAGSAGLQFGTLVVFSGGPDLAGRVTSAELEERLERSPHTRLAIGIGDDQASMRELGKDGYIDAHSKDTLSLAFEEAAHRVRANDGKYYLLAYCSPARAGRRELRIELRSEAALKREPRSGSVSTEFDARGFTPGCNPSSAPRFSPPRPR